MPTNHDWVQAQRELKEMGFRELPKTTTRANQGRTKRTNFMKCARCFQKVYIISDDDRNLCMECTFEIRKFNQESSA